MAITREDWKKYCWYFVGIMGIVFFWTGIWDGIGKLPYLTNPLISLLIGLTMLTLSQLVFFKEKDPLKATQAVLHKVHQHPHKHEFHIAYHDKIKQKNVIIRADRVKEIEKDFLILFEKGKEIFVPIHRVIEIVHKGKRYHKL